MLMLSYKDMHKSGPKCNVITCDDSLIRCLSINEMEVLTKLFFRIVIYIQKKKIWKQISIQACSRYISPIYSVYITWRKLMISIPIQFMTYHYVTT